MFDLAAVLIALGLLMYLAFRGFTLILLAPATALLAATLTGGLPILGAYTQIFMANVGQFIISFFPLFLLGAIFGKLISGRMKERLQLGGQQLVPGNQPLQPVPPFSPSLALDK